MNLYIENSKDDTRKQSSPINLIKLQDTNLIYRNLLHFYILTANYQKRKLRKQFIYNYIKKDNIPRNKFNWRGGSDSNAEDPS